MSRAYCVEIEEIVVRTVVVRAADRAGARKRAKRGEWMRLEGEDLLARNVLDVGEAR